MRANILIRMAEAFQYFQPDSAVHFGMQALEISKEVQFTPGIAKAHNCLGVAHTTSEKFDEAMNHFLAALQLFRQLGDRQQVAAVYNSIGWIYQTTENYALARDAYGEAADIFRQINKLRELCEVQHAIANAFYVQGESEPALKLFLENLALVKEHHNDQLLIDTYNQIGLLLLGKRDYESAMNYFTLNLHLADSLQDWSAECMTLQNISNVHRSQGNPSEALTLIRQALTIRKMHPGEGEPIAIGNCHLVMGEIFLEQNELKLAQLHLDTALAEAKRVEHAPAEWQACRDLALLNEKRGDFPAALHWYRRFSGLRDSVQLKEKATSLLRMQKSFELGEKEKEIRDREAENALLAETAKRQKLLFVFILTAIVLLGLAGLLALRIRSIRREEQRKREFAVELGQLERKALAAQMNPHFIFNCLNSINRYILASDGESASRYLSRFSKLIRAILENSDLNYLPLSRELETLDLYLQMETLRLGGKMTYTLHPPMGVDLNQIEIPSMLIQPFIENAIWHGISHKEGGGKVRVDFRLDENLLTCVIEDNGIGREKAKELKGETRHTSMGMGVTRKRLELLHEGKLQSAAVTIEDRVDATGQPSGTRVIIQIPAKIHED